MSAGQRPLDRGALALALAAAFAGACAVPRAAAQETTPTDDLRAPRLDTNATAGPRPARTCQTNTLRYEDLVPPNSLNSANSNLPPAPEQGLLPGAGPLGEGGRILMTVDRQSAPADGNAWIKIGLQVLDASGARIAPPTRVTLETSLGRFVLPDGRPTTRVAIEVRDGEACIDLRAPSEPGDATLRAYSGPIGVQGQVSFLPNQRPWLAVGIVEGQVLLRDLKVQSQTPEVRSDGGFEEELRNLRSTNDARDRTAAGRIGFFLKGTVWDDIVLTGAYDSDKVRRGRLFRDITPEAFYPIMGDASLKGFDARSAERGYLRLDRGKSFLLYGDYLTRTTEEARSLGQYSRSLTGLKAHFEDARYAVNVWGSYDTVKQYVDEQPGRGISGPYAVTKTNGIVNSEKVELLVRDRNQPAVILKTTPQVRFADYEFEPFSGRLIFKRPVPSVDENLNPVFIRITYEVDDGGDKFLIGGVDGQYRLADWLAVGGSFAGDNNPASRYRLGSVNTTVRLGESTVVFAEFARSEGNANYNALATLGPVAGLEGNAGRIEVRHNDEQLAARAFYGRSDPGFQNAAATLGPGREEAGGRARYKISAATALVADGLHSEDRITGGRRDGVYGGVEQMIGSRLRLDAGLRYQQQNDAPVSIFAVNPLVGGPLNSLAGFNPGGISAFNPSGVNSSFGTSSFPLSANPNARQLSDSLTSARARLTARVDEKSSVYGEGEIGLSDTDRRLAAVGGDYLLNERTRLYGRHEFINSISGIYGLDPNQRQTSTVFGVDTAVMKDTQVFSEYRMRDALAGRDAQAAIGLRNLWEIREGLRLTGAVERVKKVAGEAASGMAIAGGVEWVGSPLTKASGRLEWRDDDFGTSWLNTLAVAHKLTADWSLLARNLYLRREAKQEELGTLTQDRAQLGVAYRDVLTNLWNALGKLEYRYERDSSPLIDTLRGVSIVSVHGNYHPSRPWVFAGQYAAKFADERFFGATSRFQAQLVSARVIYDIDERWDVSVMSGVLFGDGGRQHAVGAEVGYRAIDNLWVSAGYNFTGFNDRDLVESNFTQKGFIFRIRFKFDERLLSRDDPNANSLMRLARSGEGAK